MKQAAFSRSARFNKTIAKHLALILQKEMDDPRFTLVNITEVCVTPNLAEAKVYFTAFSDKNTEQDDGDALSLALNKAKKKLRFLLAQCADLRVTPELKFFYDKKLLEARRIEALLK